MNASPQSVPRPSGCAPKKRQAFCGDVLLAAGHAAVFASAWLASAGPSQAASEEPIKPLPVAQKTDPQKIELGRLLFNDRRLSKNNTLACASCHDLSTNGADGLQRSRIYNGVNGRRNTPTVFNSGFNFRQFWDGRANSLERGVNFIVHDPNVFASDWPQIIEKLTADSQFSSQFKKVYKDGLNEKNTIDAIAVYQRSLVTPNARFDKYLKGDESAISADELKGYQLFKGYGCVACHQGVNIGGNLFQVFGIMQNRDELYEKISQGSAPDFGRFSFTGNNADRYVFKVPSLRNVAVTPPYLHNGTAPALEDAVKIMFMYQLGRTPQENDIEYITKFLRTLTGEYEGKPLTLKRPLD